MTGGDRDGRCVGDQPDLVAHALGEGTSPERERVRAALRDDLELATEFAEARDLIERFRDLSVVPTGRVARAARAAVRRRLDLRGGRPPTARERLSVGLRVAAVAVLWLGVSWTVFGGGWRRWVSGPERSPIGAPVAVVHAQRFAPAAQRVDGEIIQLCAEDHLPIDDPSFVRAFDELSRRPLPQSFEHWLSADNRLARLRGEAAARFSPEVRRAMRVATGVPDLDQRIEALAAVVAGRIEAALDESGSLQPDRIAAGLRGLLAAGSALDRGPHVETVQRVLRRCLEALTDGFEPALDEVGHAELLVALTDAAIVDGAAHGLDHVVAAEAEELARSILRRRPDGRRPELLSTRTNAGLIADVGHVLQVAPAFGTHGGLAFRARLALGAHLLERQAARPDAEQPALIAAQLFGFGDLSDRRVLDRRLVLWRAHLLLPDFRALRQFAWSRYPVRPGWAGFQRELRRLAGLATPDGVGDAAGLLSVLCTNTAAPGILNLVSQVHDG